MRLEGKVALISGAASGVEGELMGFGGAAARMFCREGAKVVLGDINTEAGERTAEQIRAARGATDPALRMALGRRVLLRAIADDPLWRWFVVV